MLYSWSFGDLPCYRWPCVVVSFLSAVCRLKLWPWRSWLGCFPASTRSSRAPPCASCSTSPSTRRCAARWFRQDSSPNSPHCSVISLCCFCLFLSVLTGLLSVCLWLWLYCTCLPLYQVSLTETDTCHEKTHIRPEPSGWGSNLLILRRMCRCSFSTDLPLVTITAVTSWKLRSVRLVRLLIHGACDTVRGISDRPFEASQGEARVTAHN